MRYRSTNALRGTKAITNSFTAVEPSVKLLKSKAAIAGL